MRLSRRMLLAALTAVAVALSWLIGIDDYRYWREAIGASVVYAVVGGVLTYRRPAEPVPLILSGIGALAGLQLLAGTWASATMGGTSAPFPAAAAASSVFQAAVVVGILQLLLRFPHGHVHGRWWKGASAAVTAGAVVHVTGLILGPPRLEDFGNVDNSLGPVPGMDAVAAVGGLIWLAGSLLAFASPIVRARRASGRERDQYAWFAYAAVVTAVLLAIGDRIGLGDLGWLIGPASLAVAVAVATVFHGLYDVRDVVSRTVAFTVAGGLLIAAHVALSTLLAAALGSGDSTARALATAVVAVASAPLFRASIQGVERTLFGERRAPARLMSQLHRQSQAVTDPESVLLAAARTIAEGLRLPFVSIHIGGGPTSSYGEPDSGRGAEEFPIVYQAGRVGRLVVQPRRGDARLGHLDRTVIEEASSQLAAAVHAVALTESLRASRARLVVAREEERRRIRRDLHDGLGPTLTGIGLKLDVIRNRLRGSDEAATEMVTQLRAETAAAINSIRRLVYDLRPPALDDLGLVGAIQEQARRLEGPGHSSSGDASGLTIRVDAPDNMTALPAATEVAAFRIVSEAMNNMVRHAKASSCSVAVKLDDGLTLEIADNGVGLPSELPPGVGIRSMTERAAEVGGRFSVESPPQGGTRVIAWLPTVDVP